MSRPPACWFEPRILSRTDASVSPAICNFAGSTMIWYCFEIPPYSRLRRRRHGKQVIFQIEVVKGAKFFRASFAIATDERVLIDPTQTRGVRPHFSFHALRQRA